MNTTIEMPRYICHKKVHALLLGEVRQSPAAENSAGGSWQLVPADTAYTAITVPHEWYNRHQPVAGGYYVVYADGYASFSPAEAFESGYTSDTGNAPAPVEPSAIGLETPARFRIGDPVSYQGFPFHVAGITFGNDGKPWATPIRYHLTRDRDNGAGMVVSDVASDQVSAPAAT